MHIGRRVRLMLSLFLMTMMAAAAFGADSATLVPLYDHKYLRYAGTSTVTVPRSPTLLRHYVRENLKPKMLLLLPLLLSQYSCRGCNAPRPRATPVLYGQRVEASVRTYSPD